MENCSNSDKSVSASKSTSKGAEGSCSIRWDDYMNRVFIRICVDEVVNMDDSDMIESDVTLGESWNVVNCSSILPTISFGEKNIEDEDEAGYEVQDLDQLVLCTVTAKGILMYYEKYIHKTPCRTSARTGHMFMEEILQGSEIRCYQAFRLAKSVFLDLCYELNHKYGLEPTRGMSTVEEMGIFLMTCAHGVDNRLLQEIFQHSGETISRHFHRVLKAVAKLANDIIAPHPEYNEGKGYHKPQHQRYMPYFKDCIGAIDGTHVKARLPEGKSIPYIGRKGYATQNILAVVDFNMCFTFVWAGWEGAAHDNRIFGEAIRNPHLNFPIPKGHKYYLVDAGYTHMPGYMGPYRGGNIRYHLDDFRRARTKQQRKPRNWKEKFNYYHSSCRNCIERTFGVWKARWNILVDMPYFHIDTQREIVLATMAIHNYIRHKNILDKAFQIAEDENYEPPIQHVSGASDGVSTVEDGGGHKNAHWLAVRDSIATEIASRS